jgi:hypothetical protein
VRHPLGPILCIAAILAVVPSKVLAMVDCPRPEPSRPAKQTRYVVAAVGDSLTDTRVGGGLYLAWLKRRCPNSQFDAYGVGGQRTNHMRWRFLHDVFGVGARPDAGTPRYTHVIILGGINDLSASPTRHVDLSDIRHNLSMMYREARQRGVKVVALTLPPWGHLADYDRRPAATLELNRWIVDQRAEHRVDFTVEIHPLLSCGDPHTLCPAFRRFGNDEIHWNAEGHAVVARAIFQDAFSDCQ